MRGIFNFLSYHNAVPIAVSIMLLGAGSIFAATNPQAIFDSTQTVVSVDNTYIAHRDLSTYTPAVEVTEVTEDTENYYVTYNFSTIDVQDAAWQDVVQEKQLKVAKTTLGEYGDLGLYLTKEFNQLVARRIQYLHEVQDIERRQVTPKVVSTQYSGLIGRFLDAKTEEFPGYVPVVTPPPTPVPAAEVAQAVSAGGSSSGAATESPPPVSRSGPGAPVIQILGNNPARIEKGTIYSDLGVLVHDDSGREFDAKKYVEGTLVPEISIDTSVPKEWHIRYGVTDNDGNTSSAERLLIVFDPFPLISPQDLASTTEVAPSTEIAEPAAPSAPAPEASEVPAADGAAASQATSSSP